MSFKNERDVPAERMQALNLKSISSIVRILMPLILCCLLILGVASLVAQMCMLKMLLHLYRC